MSDELLPAELVQAITESDFGGLISDALRAYSNEMRRQAATRGNAGPIMATHRERLRKRSTLASRAGQEIMVALYGGVTS